MTMMVLCDQWRGLSHDTGDDGIVLRDAGTGSVLNAAGEVEMDAVVMDGKTLQAGGVACVQNIKHPIQLARLIMEKVCLQSSFSMLLELPDWIPSTQTKLMKVNIDRQYGPKAMCDMSSGLHIYFRFY